MPMNVLAIAGNFFLFIEVLEKFQVVYGTFLIELFWHIIEHLEYSSLELEYESRFGWVPSLEMSRIF